MANAFEVMAAQAANCSITKPPLIVDGKRGQPESYLTNVNCTPVDPVSSDFELRPPLEKPVKLYRTCVEVTDEIKNGYRLVHGSTTYVVRNVDRLTWRGSVTQVLILEKEEVNG